MRNTLFVVLVFIFSTGWAETQPNNAALDEHVQELAQEFRCLVCQNQTIAESNAPLAADMRKLLREQVASGKTDEQIAQFMTLRYGDFILYNPPLSSSTGLLWFGPFLVLLIGLVWLVYKIRQFAGENKPDNTRD